MDSSLSFDVLLIEDEPADAGLVRHALRSLGSAFALTHRPTLHDGLAWLRDHACDVVLLDLTLPDSTGFDTIHRIREAHPSLPVIVLTGHDDEDFATQAVAAGTQDYLFKGATDGPTLKRSIRYAVARKHLEEKLRRSEQRLQSIVTLAQDAIVAVDREHRIVLFNPSAERMFGHVAAEILGQPLNSLLPERYRAPHTDQMNGYADHGQTSRGMAERREIFGLTRDGREFPAEVSISRDHQQENLLLTAVIRDITERKRFESDLRILATTDPLTGLANRRAFLATAEQELSRARRYGRPTAVLMLDIDHFKRINDSFGHAVGDQALKRVAVVSRDLLRACDLVGRLGGEEFGVLLPETDETSALTVAERLRIALAAADIPRPESGFFRLTVSIGLAASASSDSSIEQSLNRADRALYRAKSSGRNRVETETSNRLCQG